MRISEGNENVEFRPFRKENYHLKKIVGAKVYWDISVWCWGIIFTATFVWNFGSAIRLRLYSIRRRLVKHLNFSSNLRRKSWFFVELLRSVNALEGFYYPGGMAWFELVVGIGSCHPICVVDMETRFLTRNRSCKELKEFWSFCCLRKWSCLPQMRLINAKGTNLIKFSYHLSQ